MERLAFKFSAQPDYFLASICVLEAYQQHLLASELITTRKFFISDVPADLVWLLCGRDTDKLGWDASTKSFENTWDFHPDLYLDFDVQKAYSISMATEMHIVKALGIMLGCSPRSFYPNMQPFVQTISKQHVMIDSSINPNSMPSQKWWDAGLKEKWFSGKLTLQVVQDIADSQMVIGPASAMTYIAAAMGKTVVEVYPDKYHRGWFTKFTKGHYYLVPESVANDALRQATEVAWANTLKVK